jgi:hypothetical protein
VSWTALVGPTAEPGTIILDEELTVVAATSAVWTWIDLLGLRMPGAVEPLPASIRAVATQAAQARARARARSHRPAPRRACKRRTAGGRPSTPYRSSAPRVATSSPWTPRDRKTWP